MSAIGDEIPCRERECGHPFTRHDPGGGHCWDCSCAGFRWVDAAVVNPAHETDLATGEPVSEHTFGPSDVDRFFSQ